MSPEHRRSILAECAIEDTHFVCHKFTQIGDEACCRGFYDRDPVATNLMRIAEFLGKVRFVPLPDMPALMPYRKRQLARGESESDGATPKAAA